MKRNAGKRHEGLRCRELRARPSDLEAAGGAGSAEAQFRLAYIIQAVVEWQDSMPTEGDDHRLIRRGETG